MSDITLYGFPPSSYTWSARIACEEKGITHDLEGLDFGSDELLAVHPFGKIPAMRHGDFVLNETSGISHYVDEAFDGPPLQPADAKGRALQEQWISNIVDYYYPCCIKNIVIERIVVPMRGGETDEEKVANAVPDAHQFMGVADQQLAKSDYLAGEAPCIADFMMIPIAVYMSKVPEQEQILGGLGNVAAWMERMTSRPSFAATAPPPPGEG